jgi:RNA polymerase-interacting CarD/CdnL/TRCF family regulator
VITCYVQNTFLDGGKMFKVGDLAVYPAQGVGVIVGIENRDANNFSTS